MTSQNTDLPKLQIALTVDYEIFGDGSGCVEQEQCLPTDYLARVLELHGGHMTLFVETGQQIYFNTHGMTANSAPIEDQLRKLCRRGHDIQLHIHPMWFFAPPPKNGKITLDASIFDLSRLENSDIERIVSSSVAYLKSLLAPVRPSYAPIAYRAGAWSMQNTERLFDVLRTNGIRIDSTVAPGARLAAGNYGQFDFTEFDMAPFWQYGPLTEVPILTARSARSALYYTNPLGLRTRRIVSRRYKSKLTTLNKSKLQKIRDILARRYHMADFNFLSPKRLARMIQTHAHKNVGLETLPVVLIGHSKSTYFADRIHELFYELDQMQLRYEIVGLSQCLPATKRE